MKRTFEEDLAELKNEIYLLDSKLEAEEWYWIDYCKSVGKPDYQAEIELWELKKKRIREEYKTLMRADDLSRIKLLKRMKDIDEFIAKIKKEMP